MRGYRGITDTSLLHLAECSPNLQLLDVTGTSVTPQGVRKFEEIKPNCRVIANVTENKDDVDHVNVVDVDEDDEAPVAKQPE